jgi:murein peptide amidase A
MKAMVEFWRQWITSLRSPLQLALLVVLLLCAIAACVQLPQERSDDSLPAPSTLTSASEAIPTQPEPATPANLVADVIEVKAEVAEVAEVAEEDLALAVESKAELIVALQEPVPRHAELVDLLCTQLGNKLGSVSIEDCLQQEFRHAGGFSINQRSLVIKDMAPDPAPEAPFRVFLMGGIHVDEYSSISFIFKWLQLFSPAALESEFHWRIAPLVNPDGLLDGQAKRQNANGVDLNRNSPSTDWNDQAVAYWQKSTGKNPRRFPGESAASEPEVQWVIQQIEEFRPHVIVSVHAPYHLLDFDRQAKAPRKIGELYLHQLGVYPGSLGKYAGLDRRIPVVTLELPSAGIMPPQEQIRLMWQELVAWLDQEGPSNQPPYQNIGMDERGAQAPLN